MDLGFILIFHSLNILFFLFFEQKGLGRAPPLNASAIIGLTAASFPTQAHFRLLSTPNDLTCLIFLIFFFLSLLSMWTKFLSTKLKGQVEFTVTIHIS